jgi:L-rhamnose isomerase
MRKALLYALLQPNARLKALQDEANYTELMILQEELKTYPFSDIWAEYCGREGVPADESWYGAVKRYEAEVLSKRV